MNENLEILKDILKKKFKGNKSAMARGLNMKPQNVSSWFTGRRKVTHWAVQNVCDKLGLDYHKLLKSKLN